MSRPTYLNRAYDVLNNLGLSRLHPEDRNDIAIAFSEVLGEVEAAALARAARYLRSAADLIDPPDEDEDEDENGEVV
jgi:hypothetical protein